jgi:hypothetical protein
LIASTTGLAKEAIIGFQVCGDERAYQEALQRLEDQFGKKHMVICATIDRLFGRQMASAEQVRKFLYQLTSAFDILNQLDAVDEVNSQLIIETVVKHLPPFRY